MDSRKVAIKREDLSMPTGGLGFWSGVEMGGEEGRGLLRRLVRGVPPGPFVVLRDELEWRKKRHDCVPDVFGSVSWAGVGTHHTDWVGPPQTRCSRLERSADHGWKTCGGAHEGEPQAEGLGGELTAMTRAFSESQVELSSSCL